MAVDMKIGELRTGDSITMFGINQLPYIVAKDGMASLILRSGDRHDFNSINSAIDGAVNDYGENEIYVEIKSDWDYEELINVYGASVTMTTGNNLLKARIVVG